MNLRNRLLVTFVGVPILLITLLVLPSIYTVCLIAALSLIASFEIGTTFHIQQVHIRLQFMILAAIVPFLVYFAATEYALIFVLFVYMFSIFLQALFSKYTLKISDVAILFFFSVFVSYFLSSFVRMTEMELWRYYVLMPMVVAFLSDTGAMFSGMLFGKNKLAPSISPKKTREGALGGLLLGTAMLLFYGVIIDFFFDAIQVQYSYLLLYGLIGSLVSQIGDLSFSYVKRQNEIKDFGRIFPGHGGVLDRFDSVIFCAPFIEIMIWLLPAFQK